MPNTKPKIFPLGESALTVEFGNVISEELNSRAIALAEYFTANPFPGFIETVPAYASTTIFYNVCKVREEFPDFPSAFLAVKNLVEDSFSSLAKNNKSNSRLVEIPTDFSRESALDLSYIADAACLDENEVINIFTGATYRVYMLGFLPGFAYMGEVDEQIAIPRKESPRLKVPKGSVGIAGRQTGIYSLESPGGWQIIGRADLELFTPNADSPTALRAGDKIKFVPV